jgi:GNAT superfamily N-acetyltransferase
VDDLFVEAEARGVGVGEALLSQVTAWFERRGCAGTDAAVLPGQRSTKALFESSGYKARLIVMHRGTGD